MKFSSYFIRLTHSASNFTGNLSIAGRPVFANFVKVIDNLYIAHFKNQQEFKILQTIEFKSIQNSITIMLPVLSKSNKRKLKRTAALLQRADTLPREELLLELIGIEKFLKVSKLFYFLSLNKETITNFLVEKEIQKQIKVIDFHSLYTASYSHYIKCRDELNALFDGYYETRTKSIKLSEIEAKIKIPHTSIFFKYLLNSLNKDEGFKILNDKLIFQKVALTEKEKSAVKDIEKIISGNRLTVFSIEDIIKVSSLPYREVNNTLWLLLDDEKLTQLNEKYFINSEDLHKIINRLKKYKRNQGEMIDINSFRELTTFTRKHIIPILEYFDSKHITSRVGNSRKILLVV